MRRSLVSLGLVLVLSPLSLHFAFRAAGAFRVELGGADELYRTGAWGRDYEDHGPYRIRRGLRHMTYFQARVAYDGAGLRLPAVVLGGEAELRLRIHRYGQPGIVRVFANGVELGNVVFEEDSYPWDVRRFAVPSSFLESGELAIELLREETQESVDLPPGTVCAFDWVELAPGEESARLSPAGSQWFFALAIPLLVLATLRLAGVAPALSDGAALGTALVVASAHALLAGSAAYAVARLWIAFPLAAAPYVLLRRHGTLQSARRLSAAFALVVLGSSTILFFPDHLPPDVRPHGRQVARAASVAWWGEGFWELSSSYGKEGRTLSLGRPHPDADYVAPYSPWSYFLVHALRAGLDEPRFLVEYFAILFGGILVVLVYGLAATLSREPRAAGYAAALAACEISIWHHASRAHMPALLGQLALTGAILYLASRRDGLDKPAFALRFAFLSLVATLSYSASLFHFVVFIWWLVLLEAVGARSLLLERRGRALLLASSAGTLGSVLLFYRHFLGSGAGAAALQPIGYRAPATFLFLRNQVRDTVQILKFGYPAFVALAIPALVRLRSWAADEFARRVIWAWTLAYVTFLVLKDPAFFPGLFLQIKEDLFFAPLACVLGGMTLAQLTLKGRWGRVATWSVLGTFFLLRVNDFVYNADTIHPP